jgi:hypothetical protein
MSSASRSCPAASSAEVGSSRSQIGRGTAISRASESRRRWPGRQVGGGQVREASKPDAREGSSAPRLAPR